MLFHPILNQLANLDMAFLVKPADEQRIEGQTAVSVRSARRKRQTMASRAKQSRLLTSLYIIMSVVVCIMV